VVWQGSAGNRRPYADQQFLTLSTTPIAGAQVGPAGALRLPDDPSRKGPFPERRLWTIPKGAHYSGEENGLMPSHEESFNRLQNVAEIMALVGTTEDLHLDCKIWPTNENEAQKFLAKARMAAS
jgi:hypothetical protein